LNRLVAIPVRMEFIMAAAVEAPAVGTAAANAAAQAKLTDQ
jgi:hypothetical protein